MKEEKLKCPLCNGELEYRELKTEDGSMRICKVYVCLNKKCEKIYFDYEIEEGGSGEVEDKVKPSDRALTDDEKRFVDDATASFSRILARDKEKPSEADDITADWESFEEGYEQAERDFKTTIKAKIQELEAEQNRSNRAEEGMWYEKRCLKARIEVLRGLLEKKEVKK